MEATHSTQRPGVLVLSNMPQRRHVMNEGEDWTGITRAGERRKLQNRLNQRACRQRKYTKTQRKQAVSAAIELLAASDLTWPRPADATMRALAIQQGYNMLVSAQARQKVVDFARAAHESYSLGAPQPSQLHLLIKLNALNAFARNAVLLGYPVDCLCADEEVSFFSQHGPFPPSATDWPKHLEPTSVQRSTPHHPWIDLIPFPIMRDRALRAIATGLLDEDELCLDLMEVASDRMEAPSLIVWGDSSDPAGWEASLPFFEKYGWLAWGSLDILNSTNAWRARRGEKQISW